MFTKNYIHRNSACPQRASPEWPRDQCVGTMLHGSGGRPGTLVWVVGQARGLAWCWLGAQPKGWEPKSPSWEAQPDRDGMGVWSTVTGPPQGAGFRCALSRAPGADPELSADQPDPWGQSRGQAADHRSPLQTSPSCMLQRCSDP